MIRLPGRRVWGLVFAAAATTLLAVPATAASAATPAGADLNCTALVTVGIHPGLTTQSHPFATTTNGFTGTATCTGTVGGQMVTGPGSVSSTTHGTGGCPLNAATGIFLLRIPTTGGTKTVTASFTITTTLSGIFFTGDLTGTGTDVSFVGNCVTVPITSDTGALTVHVTT